jgi:chemotaxis protein methyltransferase WspC
MNFAALELLLREVMGLDSASLSPSLIARAIQTRMKACDVSDPAAYEHVARTSKFEMQELIEAIIVPETWFFRDRESFTALGRAAAQEWSALRPGDSLRVLSLPCSTGEEPYSMAMMLFDAGLPPERFRIDAVDISVRALEYARAGIYRKNSFRGDNLEFRDRYFTGDSPDWHLAEGVRRQVHFMEGNLMDASLLGGTHLYDAIFCRNVLIYFGGDAQQRVVETLDRLLTPEGILFMGPSESGLLPSDRFTSARLSHPFAFRKAKAGAFRLKEKVAVRKRANPAPPPFAVRPKARAGSPAVVLPGTPVVAPGQASTLDEAMRLADQGRFAEAAAQCEVHIRQQGSSARAYYILGLICDTGGQPGEAAAYYRKALYLDPQNEEVLAHLASLLRSQGDADGARLLLNRARRLTQRQGA